MSTSSKNGKRNIVFSIYVHLLLAIGVIVTVTGLYMLFNNWAGRNLLPKYPLGYEENRCDYLAPPYSAIEQPMPSISPDAMDAEQNRIQAEADRTKQECQAKLEEFRTTKKHQDLLNAVNVLFVGTLLLIPHAIMAWRINRK